MTPSAVRGGVEAESGAWPGSAQKGGRRGRGRRTCFRLKPFKFELHQTHETSDPARFLAAGQVRRTRAPFPEVSCKGNDILCQKCKKQEDPQRRDGPSLSGETAEGSRIVLTQKRMRPPI